MAWTYNTSQVGSSGLATVRMLIGDTDYDDQLLLDAEVKYFVSNEPNYYYAASGACRSIAAKYARKVDKAVGDLKLSLSQRTVAYLEMAKDFKRKAILTAPVNVYAGGISISDKDTVEADSDRPTPSFYREQFDYPGSVVPSSC